MSDSYPLDVSAEIAQQSEGIIRGFNILGIGPDTPAPDNVVIAGDSLKYYSSGLDGLVQKCKDILIIVDWYSMSPTTKLQEFASTVSKQIVSFISILQSAKTPEELAPVVDGVNAIGNMVSDTLVALTIRKVTSAITSTVIPEVTAQTIVNSLVYKSYMRYKLAIERGGVVDANKYKYEYSPIKKLGFIKSKYGEYYIRKT